MTDSPASDVRKTAEDAALIWARHAVSVAFEDLPPTVVEMTKKSIMDTAGVIIPASTTSPEIKAMADLIFEAGGAAQSTVLGYGRRLPAWTAGYLNGAMVNVQDFSDLHPKAAHISSPVVPAAIAIAEYDTSISGRDLITAVALGVDLQCRLTIAAGSMEPWHPAPVFGVFSAALACAKLLRLDVDQTVNTLGLAFLQASGTQQIVFGKGSTVRGIGHAVPGEVGVRAALMARAGVSGVREVFDGARGFWNAYYQGRYDRSAMLDDLGGRYEVEDNGFKPWPSCAFTHVHVDMIRALREQHDLHPSDVESITVTIGDFARGQTEPLSEWRRPANQMLAKLSIPFTVATAMLRGDVDIDDYYDDMIVDPEVLAMADRVDYRFDPAYNFVPGTGFPGGEVEIVTKDGERYSRQQPQAYGHPLKPMTWEGLVEKFEKCVGYAARDVPAEDLGRATAMFRDLESVDEAGRLFQLIG